jgi:hypothetical protein
MSKMGTQKLQGHACLHQLLFTGAGLVMSFMYLLWLQ